MWWIAMTATLAATAFDSWFLAGLAVGASIGYLAETEIGKAFWRGLTGHK